ncbi:hypothetical protein [Oceanibaculum indicum]|uniref:Uncharacterized protein n=1 Tax=Oceanibaculum indicum P24 TaxID=1207063 RepID=K2JCX5_9PROT|nr:hypothetical protein [Oceanibaculum indicum]EKE68469.1 hypothetical protein P24_17603 [Oceanibaculum indicum P24]
MDAHNDDEKRLEAAREAEAELDLFDAELSGTLSGYRGKHFPEDHARRADTHQRHADRTKAQLTALEALLASDPAYAALYNDTFDRLRGAETATEAAIAATETAVAEAQQELADTLDRASSLPDGRKAFRDPATGDVYDENGRLVEGDDLAAIVWRDDAPTWQDYQSKRQASTDARDRLDDLRRYQTDVLGRARDRLTDPDNPPTPDELNEIQENIQKQMPAHVRDHLPTSHEGPAIERTAAVKPLNLGS